MYLPQGSILFDKSDLGYCKTYRPEIGMVVGKMENIPFPDRYTVFCMGTTYVTHANQVHRVNARKGNEAC